MEIKIVSPKKIEIIPENALDNAILSVGKWKASVVPPEPFERNSVKVVIERTDP